MLTSRFTPAVVAPGTINPNRKQVIKADGTGVIRGYRNPPPTSSNQYSVFQNIAKGIFSEPKLNVFLPLVTPEGRE